VLRVERELLQLEQEELKRQRNNLAYREQKQLRLAEQLQEQWKSLQDVAQNTIKSTQQYKQYHTPTMNYRSSMPNLQFQDAPRRRPPPPPIPFTKPRVLEQRQRDVTIRWAGFLSTLRKIIREIILKVFINYIQVKIIFFVLCDNNKIVSLEII